MGLKHLRLAEELFKAEPNKLFGKTELRDLINTSYGLVLDVLSYLLHDKKIIQVEDKYKWNPTRK